MTMKHIVFLTHDPGGYDVIHPVVQQLLTLGQALEFCCVGPAAKLNPMYAKSEDRIFEILKERIAANHLSLLVTGTSWGSDLELRAISYCRDHGIQTAAVLDYWSNYALRLSELQSNAPTKLIYPDSYIVMDELARNEAISEGVPPEILRVLGHPGLDRFIALRNQDEQRSQVVHEKKLQANSVKVLFLSQPLSQLYGDTLGYTERSAVEDCLRAVGSIEREHGSQPARTLDVKFHPKDDLELQRDYTEITVTGDLLKLLPQYDLIIGMNTMGLLHAALMGISAISYQPGLKTEDVCITTKLGLTPLVTTYEDLLKELDQIQAGRNKLISSKLSQMYLWGDGKSTERIAHYLQEVASSNEN